MAKAKLFEVCYSIDGANWRSVRSTSKKKTKYLRVVIPTDMNMYEVRDALKMAGDVFEMKRAFIPKSELEHEAKMY